MKKTKAKNIDFVLSEINDSKIIFRFLPRKSHCHSFGDEPPTCWAGVYKVYYAYKVLKVYIDEEDDDEVHVIFDVGCDECSEIGEVAERCKLISEGKEEVTVTRKNIFNEEITRTIKLLDNEIRPMGDGICWNIRLSQYESISTNERLYEISLFDDWDNKGCRFFLTKDELGKFGEYLDSCCEYMLAHGEPI